MKGPWIVDFDDFEDKNTGFELLLRLKKLESNFKATLFSIPMGVTLPTIEKVKEMGWLELAVHGWNHGHKECENWTKAWALQVLEGCEQAGFAKVFRAPHWATSQNLYEALLERGWVCADHPKNVSKQPRGLLSYVVDATPGAVHGHITYGGNALAANMEYYESLHGEFLFVSEYMERKSAAGKDETMTIHSTAEGNLPDPVTFSSKKVSRRGRKLVENKEE